MNSRRRVKPHLVAEQWITLKDDQPGFIVRYIDDFIGILYFTLPCVFFDVQYFLDSRHGMVSPLGTQNLSSVLGVHYEKRYPLY